MQYLGDSRGRCTRRQCQAKQIELKLKAEASNHRNMTEEPIAVLLGGVCDSSWS